MQKIKILQRHALDLIIFSSIAVIASLNIILLYIEFRDTQFLISMISIGLERL